MEKFAWFTRNVFQFLNGVFVTDIQKAVQFYFLITRSFGGRGDTFGTVKELLAELVNLCIMFLQKLRQFMKDSIQ